MKAMLLRQPLTGLTIAVLLTAGMSAAQAQRCGVEKWEIPVRIVNQRPIANISINGTEIPVLVDSGAFFSVLDPSLAAQLDLPRFELPGTMVLQGHTGGIDAWVTRVKELRLGSAKVDNVTFMVGGNELGSGIRGILGRNVLSMADTEYDLAHGVVRLMFPKGDCSRTVMAYWAGNSPINVVPLDTAFRRHDDNTIRVEAKVNGEMVKAMLDTGAPTTSMQLHAARRAGIQEGEMQHVGRVTGAGFGSAKSWMAPVKTFELGGEKVQGNVLRVDDADGFDHEMLIGLDYFLAHRIYVARSQDKLYVTWNGGPVFAANTAASAPETDAAAPAAVAADDADVLARRGAAAAARRDYKLALADLDRAVALAPKSAGHLVDRARIYLALDRSADALKGLDEALRLDPALHEARHMRAALRIGAQDKEGALADLQELDQALPAESPLRADMADGYSELDLLPQATRQWDLWLKSRDSDIRRAWVLNNRCWLRTRLNVELQLALADCKAAVQEAGDDSHTRGTLGWTYLRLDDPRRAVESFDASIRLNGKRAWPYYGRGVAKLRLGDAAGAASDLAQARTIAPKIDANVREAGFEPAPLPPAAAGSAAASSAAGS